MNESVFASHDSFNVAVNMSDEAKKSSTTHG